MINCKECGGTVSTTANACPHCGANPSAFKDKPVNFKATEVKKKRGPMFYILAFIALSWVISFLNKGFESITSRGGESTSAAQKNTNETRQQSSASDGAVNQSQPSRVSTSGSVTSNAVTTASLSDDQMVRTCRAAISAIMSQPVNITFGMMRGGFAQVSYVRPMDGQQFDYQCKFSGDTVIWRGFIDRQWGRWRDGPHDSVVKFVVNGSIINIKEFYGASVAVDKDIEI